MESVNNELNASDQVTANDATTGAIYDELESESGYSSVEAAPYFGLQRSTRELPPPPTVYDSLTRPDYVNT